MEQVVTSYCKINNNGVWVNGKELIIDASKAEETSFLTRIYRHVNMGYPKFFKMDNLCKLGMLATELALKGSNVLNTENKQKVAIVLSNNASSLDTDRNYQQSITDKANYFPSPAVFVYTLPNIVIGEIAIRHKFTGENAFFVSEHFDADELYSYSNILLKEKHTDALIAGWVNVDGNNMDAFVYCVEKSNFNQEFTTDYKSHTVEAIQQLYTKN